MIHVARRSKVGRNTRAGMNAIVGRRIHIISLFPPALTPEAYHDEFVLAVDLLLSDGLGPRWRLAGVSRTHRAGNLRRQGVTDPVGRRQEHCLEEGDSRA